MNKALIIFDAQNGIIKNNFKEEIGTIYNLIRDFKKSNNIIISTKHIDNEPLSPIYYNSDSGELDSLIKENSDYIIEKTSPNPFYKTNLEKIIQDNNINHIFISGFNAEYCCLFSSIILESKGYKVSYIEDATGSINNGETYEMNDLDIKDFIGCILDWSGIIEVLYYDEIKGKYDKL